MILTGPRIQQGVEQGEITIEPFLPEFINPNSYDVRLGDVLKVYKNTILDSKQPNETEDITIPEEGYLLKPDVLYLGHTVEKIGSDKYVPIVRGKSSTGRAGLFVHITADLVDIGFCGQLTLMLHAVQPLVIYPGMRIGQVTFWKTAGDIRLYEGKYQSSAGARASEAYRDFKKS